MTKVTPGPTERLRFREMHDGDLDDLAALLGDPEVMRYYSSPKTREQAQGWIDWNLRNYAEHGFGLWIVETHDGEFVGDCGLTWQEVDGVRDVEVGYHVRTALQGQGFATEAAAACRDAAREAGVERLTANVRADNIASQRVAQKIGLTEWTRSTGHGVDVVVFGAALA
ncbi:GNAT family N-acetyltransferase [Promicromonospora aerolata]|uniref:GNAT family N-acetyltransferase n=1 Tax=Promicromonospora aerolata TaxID=195749 RepID=A0ABW4VEZ3_9MICO